MEEFHFGDEVEILQTVGFTVSAIRKCVSDEHFASTQFLLFAIRQDSETE